MQHPERPSRLLRRVGIGVFAFVTFAVIGGTAAWFGIGHVDLAASVAPRLSAKLGRPVRIAHLHVHPGRWIGVEIEGAHLANIAGGSRPDMASLNRLDAEIRLSSLIHGPMETRNVRIAGLSVLTERTANRTPNWRFGDQTRSPRSQERQISPSIDLSWFPGLRQVRFSDSDVTYRTAKGSTYKVDLHSMELASASDDAPFTMRMNGAYNATPVEITSDMQSIALLRRSPKPYGLSAHVVSGDTTIDFKGTTRDLLDFDQVDGHLTINTSTGKAILGMVGLKEAPPLALTLDGEFTHNDTRWTLTKTHGTIQKSALHDTNLSLVEGLHGKPDNVSGTIAFETADMDELLTPFQRGKNAGQHPNADLPIIALAKPDPVVHATVTADRIVYDRQVFSNVKLSAEQTEGRIDVPEFSLGFIGATLNAHGAIAKDGAASRMDATVTLLHGNIDQLRRIAGLAPVPVQGLLSIHVQASARGVTTLNQATRNADVVAAVSMEKGEIAREIVEAASMDLRLLFRHAKGTTPITCMLGVMQLHQGIGRVVPLRIRTGEGIITAKVDFDLRKKWLDLVFASRPFSTSFFALDIPVRVKGPFDKPSLSLASFSGKGRDLLAESNAAISLPPALRGFAASNPCARPSH